MKPYIYSKSKESSVNCNCDLLIGKLFDRYSFKIMLVSLVDYPMIVKKVCSDFFISSSDIYLKDKSNKNYKQKLYTYNNNFTFKSDACGNYRHSIVMNKKEMEYCVIDWKGVGKKKIICDFIQNKLQKPIIADMLDEKSLNRISEELDVVTDNPLYKGVRAYKVYSYNIDSIINNYNFEEKDNFDWNNIETIQDYIYKFLNPIKSKVLDTINVLYDKNNIEPSINEGIKLLNGQVPVVQGGLEVLKKEKALYIGAEQGFGKTIVATKINNSYMNMISKKCYNTLIVAPAITLTQWKEEIKKVINKDVDIHIIKKTNDFIKLYEKNPKKPTYYIVGKETFKLSYATEPSYNVHTRKVDTDKVTCFDYKYKDKEIMKVLTCPCCGLPLVNSNRVDITYLEETDFKKQNKTNSKCSNCGEKLWSATYNKTKKTSVMDYIHRKKIIFDSVILDEAHEGNNSGSIIGNATRTILRNHCKKAICLSGTSNNGYASSLYNILMALFPNKLKQDDCLEVKDFIEKYGTLQAMTPIDDDRRYYSLSGKTEIKDSAFKEIEGVNPIVFTKYLSSNYIFASIKDVKDNLPPLKTNYVPIIPTQEQIKNSKMIFDKMKQADSFNAKMYIDSIIKHYINNPTTWDNMEVKCGDKVETIEFPQIDMSCLLPKEEKLLEIVKQEYSEGRKVWIYTEFNNGGQYMKGETVPNRLKRILENEGYKVYVLTTSTSTIERREVIEKNKDKYDIFICNPRLVNVGINLVFCPTYIFYQPSYRVDVVSQASARGYRANATLENRVYHLYYKDTFEEEIEDRYQRKIAESNAINGRFDVALENKKIRTASSFSSTLVG